jgi:transposase
MNTLGLDIAKKTFHATVLSDRPVCRRTFKNTPAGFLDLQKWLTKKSLHTLHVCLEATGAYWQDVAAFLHHLGYSVSVLNPLRIKAFAQSQLARTKTDRYDSWVIARFCQVMCPALWTPPSAPQTTLTALSRYYDALDKTLTQHRNRLEACREPQVRTLLETFIGTIQRQMADLTQLMQQHVAADQMLQHRYELLCSIPGIGALTAIRLLAELPHLAAYASARQVTAYAGVTPKQFQSGTSVAGRPKLSKIGNPRIRKALYFPAMVAIRHNPIISALAERLRARGKSKMCIIGAAMRKLLHLVYGVVKHDTKFDANFASAS